MCLMEGSKAKGRRKRCLKMSAAAHSVIAVKACKVPSNEGIDALQVNDPESAIRDTTAVIEAVENGAVSERKKQRELLERATYRCVNAACCI